MTNEQLIEQIIELEARVLTAEKFINSIVELNNLKVAKQNELESELATQRIKAQKKYLGHF